MFPNSDGVSVDPVPFLVVSVLGVALSITVGPLYVMELGGSLPVGLVVTTDGAGPDTDHAIEVDEAEARRVSPAAWLGGLKHRLEDAAARLTYRR